MLLSVQDLDCVFTRLRGARIGLVGDLFLDRYLDLDSGLNEPSVETGKTAYQVVRIRHYPGALGTVLNNLVALGAGSLVPITCLGDDGEGSTLLKILSGIRTVDTDKILIEPTRFTPTYCKPILMTGAHAEELNRLDTKNRTPLPRPIEDRLRELVSSAWQTLDAVIVLDQVSEEDCGVITSGMRMHLAELAKETPSKPVLADSRNRIGLFRHMSVKPNAGECQAAITEPQSSSPWQTLARQVQGVVYGTLGAEGIRVVQESTQTDLPAVPVTGPVDICGAGDSCSAGIIAGLVARLDPIRSAELAMLIASITIQQIGVTGTATESQVRERWNLCHQQAG
jgi:bifunctional ADP-heptose synthase (sugar kinase/adenylyltransferase)